MDKKKLFTRIGLGLLAGFVVAFDQITKAIVVAKISLGLVAWSSGSGFLRFIHVRNNAVAFSMGKDFPEWLKFILFKLLVAVFLIGLAVYVIKHLDKFPGGEKWAFAMIIGGGMGNLTDRIFRPGGVVDFIDVKFYGIFGLDRWPTFNIADSAVVIGVGVLFVCYTVDAIMKKKN